MRTEPPPPAPMTADEVLSAAGGGALGLTATVQRWASRLGLLALALAIAYVAGYCRGRAACRPPAPPPALAPILVEADSVDTVYVRDTTALVTALARYRALRAELDALRGQAPAVVHDTVRDTVRMVVVPAATLAAADTLARACDALAQTCARVLAERDTLRRVLASLPPARACPAHRLGVMAGYGLSGGRLGWQLTAGVRLWP
jgi:hypothetical protein